MQAKETYLKGKSVFKISLIVIGITILTVYLSGINYNRTITSNLYLSLGIIGFCLFTFMTYGLYKGIGLIDDFPKYKDFKSGDIFSSSGELPDMAIVDSGEGIGGILLSILLWIAMAIFFIIVLVMVEAIFWFSLFVILTMLYWVFFRALRLVFSKSDETRGNIGLSALYALGYTILFTGWIFGITYLVETLK